MATIIQRLWIVTGTCPPDVYEAISSDRNAIGAQLVMLNMKKLRKVRENRTRIRIPPRVRLFLYLNESKNDLQVC